MIIICQGNGTVTKITRSGCILTGPGREVATQGFQGELFYVVSRLVEVFDLGLQSALCGFLVGGGIMISHSQTEHIRNKAKTTLLGASD